MNMRFLPERLGLLPWIVRTANVIAIGIGFFHWSVAFSQTDGVPARDPVVLELFTSQGWWDCPPADALLSDLGSSDRGVIPLAYHVDYWNHLGWSDPFSSRQFSERQSEYARAMKLTGEYTPQMVIGGAWQFVGSDSRSIARAVSAAHSTSTPGRARLPTNLGAESPRSLEVNVRAQSRPASAPGPFVVMVAVYENGLVSKIGAGENRGREITYDYTVRKLLPAFELDGAQAVEKEVRIELAPSLSASHLGAAAFIQNTSSVKTVCVASGTLIAI